MCEGLKDLKLYFDYKTLKACALRMEPYFGNWHCGNPEISNNRGWTTTILEKREESSVSFIDIVNAN